MEYLNLSDSINLYRLESNQKPECLIRQLKEVDGSFYDAIRIDAFVKSNKMAKEKGPHIRFSVWPGLK